MRREACGDEANAEHSLFDLINFNNASADCVKQTKMLIWPLISSERTQIILYSVDHNVQLADPRELSLVVPPGPLLEHFSRFDISSGIFMQSSLS